MSQPPDKSANRFGWILGGIGAIGLVAWISNSTNTTTSAPTATLADSAVGVENAEANLSTPAPAPPTPIDVSAAQRGYAQFRKLSTLGPDGSAQIYSRNCYDALGKAFDWHQLDRCGGFDALASRWTEESDSVDSDALTFFQSETAATRYLQAASANGLPASDADQRWARIQAMAQKARLNTAPKIAIEPMDNDTDADTTLNALSEASALNSTDD
jgi:hypothetical protein